MAIEPNISPAQNISWNRNAKKDLASNRPYSFDPNSVVAGAYRPFARQNAYFHRDMNAMLYQLPSMFPTPNHKNIGIVLTGPASHFEFTPFITDLLPNLHVLDTGQFFPRWTYEKAEPSDGGLNFASPSKEDADEWGYRRIDNITDGILTLYRKTVGEQVEKDDVFFYVYGLLHDPMYRITYASDLKKMLPRIPTPGNRHHFEQLSSAGRRLADLHVDYEAIEPYPLDVQLKSGVSADDRDTWRVTKMKWSRKKDPKTGKNVDDRTTIIYNPKVTISGIPEEAERYMLGSRSALAWIIDQYQVKTDKASGITNDPNAWCDEHDHPTYIVHLIKRVTTVAVETMKIVDSLG